MLPLHCQPIPATPKYAIFSNPLTELKRKKMYRKLYVLLIFSKLEVTKLLMNNTHIRYRNANTNPLAELN